MAQGSYTLTQKHKSTFLQVMESSYVEDDLRPLENINPLSDKYQNR
jgi:hypothetical protein